MADEEIETVQDKGDIFDEYFGDDEPEEVVNENLTVEPEPLHIDTKGKWQPIEAMIGQVFDLNKTYHIHIDGVCEFSLSEATPLAGMQTNDITYTKNDKIKLWIKTGEKING